MLQRPWKEQIRGLWRAG